MIALALGLSATRPAAPPDGAVAGLAPDLLYRARDGNAWPFAFARSTSASYVDATGRLRQAAPDQPRAAHHVYEAGSWRPAGLLIEPRTGHNLNPHGSALSAWTDINLTAMTDGAATGPDGTASLARLTARSGTGDRGVRRNMAPDVAVGTPVTVSAYVARGTHRFLGVWGFGNGGSGVGFDLETDRVQINGNWQAAGIEPHGPDLVRIWACCTPQADAFCYLGFFSSITGAKTLAGGEELLLGCVQVEAANGPGSYVPTSGSAASRAGDSLSIPAAGSPFGGAMPQAISLALRGRIRPFGDARFYEWSAPSGLLIAALNSGGAVVVEQGNLGASGTATGLLEGTLAGHDRPFALATRHAGTTFGGATGAGPMTEGSATGSLPDLSGRSLALLTGDAAFTLAELRLWATDIGASGLREAVA